MGGCYHHIIYAEYTRLSISVWVCVYVYVTISDCQLQFFRPEENTVVSLRALLVPLSYRCAGLPLCQFLCVRVSVSYDRKLNRIPYSFYNTVDFWFLLISVSHLIDI